MKSEEGNKATFSHWPRLDTLSATQAWISLRHLPQAKASKKAVLRGAKQSSVLLYSVIHTQFEIFQVYKLIFSNKYKYQYNFSQNIKIIKKLNCLSTMVVKAGIVTGDTL